MLTLDTYNGSAWTRTNLDASNGIPLTAPVLPQTGDAPSSGPTLDQDFRILADIGQPALPLALAPLEIDVPNGQVTWDPTTGSAFFDGEVETG